MVINGLSSLYFWINSESKYLMIYLKIHYSKEYHYFFSSVIVNYAKNPIIFIFPKGIQQKTITYFNLIYNHP